MSRCSSADDVAESPSATVRGSLSEPPGQPGDSPLSWVSPPRCSTRPRSIIPECQPNRGRPLCRFPRKTRLRRWKAARRALTPAEGSHDQVPAEPFLGRVCTGDRFSSLALADPRMARLDRAGLALRARRRRRIDGVGTRRSSACRPWCPCRSWPGANGCGHGAWLYCSSTGWPSKTRGCATWRTHKTLQTTGLRSWSRWTLGLVKPKVVSLALPIRRRTPHRRGTSRSRRRCRRDRGRVPAHYGCRSPTEVPEQHQEGSSIMLPMARRTRTTTRHHEGDSIVTTIERITDLTVTTTSAVDWNFNGSGNTSSANAGDVVVYTYNTGAASRSMVGDLPRDGRQCVVPGAPCFPERRPGRDVQPVPCSGLRLGTAEHSVNTL